MSGTLYRRLSVKPFSDSRGALCVWEQERHVPYRIARTYFTTENRTVVVTMPKGGNGSQGGRR